MFESLKKKFNGTIGKISDKITEEEKLEASSEKKGTNETTEKLESPDNSVKDESDKVVEESLTEPNSMKESDDNKSGIMGFLRGKSKESDKIKVDSKSSVETDFSKLKNPISDELKSEEELSKDEEDEKSGIFSFVKHKTISEKDIDDILFELEMALLEGDVAMDVAEQIIKSVKEDLIGRKIKRRSDVSDFTKEALRKALSNILDIETSANGGSSFQTNSYLYCKIMILLINAQVAIYKHK